MEKQVKFDRVTRDYDAFLDGQYVGSFQTPGDAQAELDRLAYDFLRRH